jgi:hypothetical protein
MINPAEALDAVEQALGGCKKLLVAIKNSNDLDGRIAFLPQKTEETIQNAFEALAHIATLRQQVAELVAFRETHQWQPIDTAPKDGSTFHINSGPVPGNACCSNVEEPGCGIEWRYNTLRTQGWTNSLTSLATHWQPLPTPPAAEGGQGE